MSFLRLLLTMLALVAGVFVLLWVGVPLAVHTAAVLTPTGYARYAWSTPGLLTQLLQGAPIPAATLGCLVVFVIVLAMTGVVVKVGVFGWAGRASIVRLWAFTTWKSRPARQPLTAKQAEPLGRIGWFGFFGLRWFTDLLEEQRVLIAPSGMGKTVRLVVQLIFRARGPVVTTSVKPDVLMVTARIRQERFPDARVSVFDPEGLVPWWADRVTWNIVAGCQDDQEAMKRAAAIVAARPMNGKESTNAGFFTQAVTIVLQCMLHAAAVDGRTMRDVMTWMNNFDDETPYDILKYHPDARHEWAALLTKYCRGKADETVSSTDMSASGILNAFSINSILNAVCPGDGDVELDHRTFHQAPNTLYLICKGEDSPAAAVFTALVESLYRAASDHATRTGPLNPPLEFVLDEFANVCPLPSAPRLMSTGRGEGVSGTVVLQDYQQLVNRYGDSQAKTIVNNATELLVLGGLKDDDHLKSLSALAGNLTDHGAGRAEQVMAPDKIRTLWEGKALFFYRNQPATVLTLPAWFRSRHRHIYQAAADWAKAQQDQFTADRPAAAETTLEPVTEHELVSETATPEASPR